MKDKSFTRRFVRCTKPPDFGKGMVIFMEKYLRTALEVEARQYEPGQGMEDGFELWSQVVTHGWIIADDLIQITRQDGTLVCPFIQNRRGNIFIRKGDYIIYESNGERHVCGEDRFHERYHTK